MSTLLLKLAGVLQSWGVESKFETRRTLGFPTKSGVVGLLASALGYSREEPLDRLSALRFGIRVEREGELLRDYHIARGKKDKDVYITERFYLADAVFLAGFESKDTAFINELADAVRTPAYPLYLGRRSCVPSMPLLLGIREMPLLETLQNEPLQLSEHRNYNFRDSDNRLHIITDSEEPDPSSGFNDFPISFSRKHRKFGFRSIKEYGYSDEMR